MYQIDFKKPVHVYFIGIGGISMSGIAQILQNRGFQISGSDSKHSAMTDSLEALGIHICYGQKAENISEASPIDVIVYTSAIHPDNPEYAAAVSAGIPMLTRAQLLGQIMKYFKMPVAISGTHGKTTTTSMISKILLDAGTDPTLSIGGVFKDINGNTRIGHSDYFVAEACEYTNSFLSLFPKVSVVLDIDADHLDFFKDLDDIRNSFHLFAKLLPENGTLVINGDIDKIEEITSDLSCRVITFGKEASLDYSAANITYNEQGNASFDVVKDGQNVAHLALAVGGEHNVYNALAAIAVADILGVPAETIQTGLASFHGTDRRFEYKGEVGGVTIIDDYAHHPTEIAATLKSAAHYPHKKLWCIFQPHTYTRTKALFSEFAEALAHADHVILADIYAARETDTLGISSAQLADAVKEHGCDATYLPSFAAIEEFVTTHCQPGDLLITMGAGDVVTIGEDLLKA